MVFGFSWLVEEMMNGHGKLIREIVLRVDIVRNDKKLSLNVLM